MDTHSPRRAVQTFPSDHRIEIMLTDREAEELYNLLGRVGHVPRHDEKLLHGLRGMLLGVLGDLP